MEEKVNQAWYRKYRPKTIDDYMGDYIKRIVNARFRDRSILPQVIMLYGTKGCGKTSFARIISKYYLCENPIDGKPCESCEMCETINNVLIAGESGIEVPGIVEIDATIANGKEAIQNIIDDALIEPMYGNYKILIFDECHMITPQAQNSLLKIIEDIPSHLVCIFCTTNPEKVLGTIHSRCQLKIEVKKKSVDELANRLLYIAEQEGLETSLEALKIIAKKADRIPRDAINLLETIAKNYGNIVNIDNVREYIGDIASELYINYIKASKKGLEDILIFVNELKKKEIDIGNFLYGLTRFILDSMYIKYAINIEDYPIEYVKQIKNLFKNYKDNEFDGLLEIIENAYKAIGNNEVRNEFILVLAATKIGKVELISKGLNNEVDVAKKENDMSLKNYRNIKNEESKKELDKIKPFSPTKEKLESLLGNSTSIVTIGKIDNVIEEDGDIEKSSDDEYSIDELTDLLNG